MQSYGAVAQYEQHQQLDHVQVEGRGHASGHVSSAHAADCCHNTIAGDVVPAPANPETDLTTPGTGTNIDTGNTNTKNIDGSENNSIHAHTSSSRESNTTRVATQRLEHDPTRFLSAAAAAVANNSSSLTQLHHDCAAGNRANAAAIVAANAHSPCHRGDSHCSTAAAAASVPAPAASANRSTRSGRGPSQQGAHGDFETDHAKNNNVALMGSAESWGWSNGATRDNVNVTIAADTAALDVQDLPNMHAPGQSADTVVHGQLEGGQSNSNSRSQLSDCGQGDCGHLDCAICGRAHHYNTIAQLH